MELPDTSVFERMQIAYQNHAAREMGNRFCRWDHVTAKGLDQPMPDVTSKEIAEVTRDFLNSAFFHADENSKDCDLEECYDKIWWMFGDGRNLIQMEGYLKELTEEEFNFVING